MQCFFFEPHYKILFALRLFPWPFRSMASPWLVFESSVLVVGAESDGTNCRCALQINVDVNVNQRRNCYDGGKRDGSGHYNSVQFKIFAYSSLYVFASPRKPNLTQYQRLSSTHTIMLHVLRDSRVHSGVWSSTTIHG